MAGPRVVLDTNVVVAGLRSRRGCSFKLLSQLGREAFEIAVSVPLVLEYEEALIAHRRSTGMTQRDVRVFIEYLISVAERRSVFFLWRPLLRDPGDDMVLELAVAAECTAVVTFNRRDFAGADRFGVAVVSPREFLESIGGTS